MKDKIVLITGATAGIGKETAREIAKLGANVVIIGRNAQKTESVAAELKKSSGNEKIETIVADLSLMSEIRRIAEEFKAKYQRLDVLINNAGAIFDERQTTTEGLEKTFALNHVSYFLLTNLLLDLLKNSASSRIVSVSSIAHSFGKIDFDNLQSEKSFSKLSSYSASKLMNVLFTYELARRLAGTNVTANCLHPGAVDSNFGDELTGIFGWITQIGKKLAFISPEKGAETSIYLATSTEVETVSGKYFDKKKAVESSAASHDENLQKKLWAESEKIVGE